MTTNTIIEGVTLAVGLLQLERRGWIIRRGTSPHPWPSTSANLSIVEVWASTGPLSVEAVLDNEPVPHLSIDLQPYLHETGRPRLLQENAGLAFQGSIILGLGFTLAPEEAATLIREDPHNCEVLFPYVIGADLNRRPDTSASRWVINFRDWTLDQAEDYPDLVDQVRRRVKPERDRNRRQSRRDRWWMFAERAPDLYDTINDLDHILAMSQVGSVLLPVRVRPQQVFDQRCVVFALPSFGDLAVLSASAHTTWSLRYASTLETRITYNQSLVFSSFPRPRITNALTILGEALDSERRQLMLNRGVGLTKLYNLVHDPTTSDPGIVRLREVHREIDVATLAAYDWDDLDPQVGHHPTKIGVRWTISPAARFELLDRLLVENHRRAAAQ